MLEASGSSEVGAASAMRVLIASADISFADRFCKAFAAIGAHAVYVQEGFEALTMLETSSYSVLLFDAGCVENFQPALSGIRGDELAHMWRQIERRGEHITIGAVSRRGNSDPTLPRSRFGQDPADHARNRGADYHFWDDQSDQDIVRPLLQDVQVNRTKLREAVEAADGKRVLAIRPR